MLNGNHDAADPYGIYTPNVARRVLNVAPDVPDAALENREFLRRALASLVVQAGIRQFVDIGPGFPLIAGYPDDSTRQHHVHQITQRLDACRVVYVERDPVVAVNVEALLVGPRTHTAAIRGDLRDPDTLLASLKLTQLLDLDQPICLTCDGRDDDILKTITDAYSNANAPLVMRTRTELSRFFPGFDLVPPGLVYTPQWRPTLLEAAYGRAGQGGTRWVYGAVARKS
jgi:hypothetical protein